MRLHSFSLEGQYCLADMIELGMYVERVNGEMPLLVHRKLAYFGQRLSRKPYLHGTVRSATGKELLQFGFIKQAFGETFVGSAQEFECLAESVVLADGS
jgi:hypothetical protein